MNLWQIDDKGDPFDGQWCAAIWAWGQDEALQVAIDAYEYPPALEGKNAEEFFRVRLLSEWPGQRQDPDPTKTYPHIERRYRVLRQAGWMEEGEYQCESCGLYPMGMTSYCDDCMTCGDCGCICEDQE